VYYIDIEPHIKYRYYFSVYIEYLSYKAMGYEVKILKGGNQ